MTTTPKPQVERPLYKADGSPVRRGEIVTSFRGEEWIVTGWPSDGRNRVYVMHAEDTKSTAEFFPSVFDLSWDAPVKEELTASIDALKKD